MAEPSEFSAIGVVLKSKREAAKLTQKQLARLAYGEDDYQSLISRYEAGLVEPSMTALRTLAPVLGLNLGDFGEIQPAASAPTS